MNQSANLADVWLADSTHPICCDTSALYYPGILRYLRQRFPVRHILLPTIAYFERQRQLRVRFGPSYRSEVLRQNLLEPLEIELISCGESIALSLVQMAEQVETRTLSSLAGDQTWLEQKARQEMIRAYARQLRDQQANWIPLLQGERDLPMPCGQRCRLGDYIIAATARSSSALLLTADEALLDAFDHHPDLFPPALSPRVLA